MLGATNPVNHAFPQSPKQTTRRILLSDSGMLDVMEELVDVKVLTDGGRPGNSPVGGCNTTSYSFQTLSKAFHLDSFVTINNHCKQSWPYIILVFNPDFYHIWIKCD